jgi:type I restriction enzyme S subunit
MTPELLLAHFVRISDAPDAVPCLRRFILELAVRGKLVDQNANDEPASKLLETIHVKTTSPVVAGEIAKPSIEYFSNDDVPFEIPPAWIWVRLGDICSKTGSGSTPRGGRSVYQPDGVPFLRSQNVYDDGLRLDDVAYITDQTHEKMSGTAVQPGDLLLNITGGSIGRCCDVRSGLGQANVSQHVAIIRVAIDGIQRYLHRLILSPYFQSFVLTQQTGAGRGGLPKNRMDRIPIALPPQAEQHRIVAKVDELMALCDRLEAVQAERSSRLDRFAAASLYHLNNGGNAEDLRAHARFFLTHIQRLTTYPKHIVGLRQAILNLAIRGRLVYQELNDEPASEVLSAFKRRKRGS